MGKHFTIPAPSTAKVWPALQLRVLNRDANTCVYCGAVGVALEVDHVKPRAHFPETAPSAAVNAPSNLVTACDVCNGAKGPQSLAGFATMLRSRGLPAATITAMLRRVRAAVRRPL